MTGAIVRAKADPRPVRQQNRPKRDIPPAVRRYVLQAEACHYCGDVLLPREVEHRVPLSRGGTNAVDNLLAACVSCNSDKKAMQLHEWRTLRQAHGLPWPPLASHATDPRHYCHSCRDCSRGAGFPGPAHRFVLVPAQLVADDGGVLRALYLCPNDHNWYVTWRPDDSYYSDCPCLYCWHAREDEGESHETRPARWNEVCADGR